MHHNRITKVSNKMNKAISTELIARANKCVFDMRNGAHFYETTKIHVATLTRIIDRKWGTDEQIEAIEKYCDEVEGVTVEAKKD